MSLFQKSVEKKYLNDLDSVKIDEKYNEFLQYFGNSQIQNNIRNAKEEQFQEGFLRELFVKILGYTLNPEPNFNLISEFKNIVNSRKADGAILKNGEAVAVIELKSTSTADLDIVESQAFGYKSNQPKCIYVITSNFEKLRFYIQSTVDHLDFDLFSLTREQFCLMWLCLQKDNLLNDIPLKIKESSVLQEENITKKLYADYSKFRTEIYNNLVKNNIGEIGTTGAKHVSGSIPTSCSIPTLKRGVESDISPDAIHTSDAIHESGDIPMLKHRVDSDISHDSINPTLQRGDSQTQHGDRNDAHINPTLQRGDIKPIPEMDKLLLFKKTQKLLDRFLFIFFAEDRLLLPPNTINEILSKWKSLQDDHDEYFPLYDRFKKFFGYLNTGFKGKNYDIYPYNGGLFAPDDVLDNVTINDNILYENTTKLSNYDFETDVDVNILGHIFEHSLGEIETVEAEIKGLKIDQQKSKRKKDGIFYTPKYITKYLVENTLGKLCKEKRIELGIVDEEYTIVRKGKDREIILVLDEKLTEYRNWLLSLKILDPACGSGAFLNQALDFLIEEHRKIDELRAQLYGGGFVFSDITTDILENNIFGVDINEESVEIAKLSLWLRTAQKGRKLNTLSNNIKCGNSLIDDPAIAGDKAFNWEKEFPQVFGQRKTVEYEQISYVPKEEPDYLSLIKINAKEAKEKSEQAKEKAEQAISLSKQAAELSKIVYEYAEKLQYVSEPNEYYGVKKGGFDVVIGNPPYGAELSEIEQYFYNRKYQIGSTDTAILFIKKSKSLLNRNGQLGFIIPKAFSFASNYQKIREYIWDNLKILIDCRKVWKEVLLEQVILIIDTEINDTYSAGVLKNYEIEIIGNVNKSIAKKFGFFINGVSDTEIDIANKIFDNSIFLNDIAVNRRGAILQKYIEQISLNEANISNVGLTLRLQEEEILVIGGAEIDKFGIKGIKGKISKSLINSSHAFINDNSLLVQNIIAHIENPTDHIMITACIPNRNDVIIVDTINQITMNDNNSNKFIWCILKSNLINWYSYRFILGKAIRTMHFDNAITSRIPIINVNRAEQLPFIEKADKMLSLNKELQELSQKFQRSLIREYSPLLDSGLSQKLQEWYKLSYTEFIKELEKKKIKLTLNKKAEWEDYFLQESKKAMEIKTIIDQTDRKIDEMVYDLYGLTEEEIKIVVGE